jgi:hypothetical protein
MVRNAAEQSKPNDVRLPEYRSSEKRSLDLEMFSEAPIYDSLEIELIADGFLDWAEHYSIDDPLVRQVLAGKSAHDRAFELVTGTKLKDTPAMTKLSGLYERASEHNNEHPFNLTPRWLEHKKDLDLQTPFNFVQSRLAFPSKRTCPQCETAKSRVGVASPIQLHVTDTRQPGTKTSLAAGSLVWSPKSLPA